ncbi:alpha/beta fold hydrolase [Thermocoleostomius sinensis]|uniref:Alpha/beta hydrolase n=1 Tax=Thermocoleostomius sinensis A174 TaxID=2016057 RepID=A0A9E8ZCZ3_9CYAN|nr:alpha/beta hydrolase [Thermocoleostomius sinensis]WAL60652.1 alpha/beta hydrolase [Thermocoleostomius sinensis A174]
MPQRPDMLWLSVSSGLRCFDRPLLHYLAQFATVAQWEYNQLQDEPNSFETALTLLHDYVQQQSRPLHLAGHGTGGLLGLLYAQRHPDSVRSLAICSVGVQPTLDWQAHYHVRRRLLPCPRLKVLQQMVYDLFGCPPPCTMSALVKLLEQDLEQSLSPHNLFRQLSLPPLEVAVPLLVCGGVDDVVLDPNQLQGWESHWRHPHSRLWICPGGRYFFHYFYPQQVGDEVRSFWQQLSLDETVALAPATVGVR